MTREHAHRLVAALRRRCATDPGFAASLRRDANQTLSTTRMLVPWAAFHERLNLTPRDEELHHLIATLFALDRRGYRRSAEESDAVGLTTPTGSDAAARIRNLGASLASRARAAPSEEKGLARRLTMLLDSSLEPDGTGTLPWRLRRTITLLLSKGGDVDWTQLSWDLPLWNHDDRFVQRQWAQAFYRESAPVKVPSDEADAIPATSNAE